MTWIFRLMEYRTFPRRQDLGYVCRSDGSIWECKERAIAEDMQYQLSLKATKNGVGCAYRVVERLPDDLTLDVKLPSCEK